jgi:fusion and transport protein UGO1
LLQSIFVLDPSLTSPSTSFLLPLASHLLTGFIISPLDLIRTRLVAQSSMSRHRTYTGPLDALLQILRHEGGLKGIYLHPHLLYPTILDNAIRPIVSLTLPPYIASHLGLHGTVDTNPIAWALAELVGSSAGLLLILPFETIRRRLQAQVRGTAKPLRSCVESRPAPYNGVVDALWHILTEERSDLPRRSKHKGKGKETEAVGDSWWRSTGIGQLYRGLGMRLSASVVVFMLGVVSGGYDSDPGWAEL